jgi:hypothetical protein
MDEEYSVEYIQAMLEVRYPLTIHTGAGRLYTTVRRMKAEKEWGLPIHLRIGGAISVASGKAANQMSEAEWEAFYQAMCGQLRRDYPELYKQLFPENNGAE